MKIIICIFGLLVCCNSRTNPEAKTNPVAAKSQGHKFDEICQDGYCLKTETSYLSQSVRENVNPTVHNDQLLFFTGVKYQRLHFYKDGRLIGKSDYPVQFLDLKKAQEGAFKIQENVIYEVAVIKGKDDWFYKISGNGLLQSQSEFYGVYSKEGSLLWCNYLTERGFEGDPNKSVGDLDRFFTDHHFTDDTFNCPVKKIEIDIPVGK